MLKLFDILKKWKRCEIFKNEKISVIAADARDVRGESTREQGNSTVGRYSYVEKIVETYPGTTSVTSECVKVGVTRKLSARQETKRS